MSASNVDAVRAEHEAFNNRDWDSMKGLIADDCVFVDARGERHVGPDAFVEDYAKGWSNAFSNAKVTEARYHDAGDTVVAEFIGRGTNDGPLGPLPASGREVNIPYCEIYEFDGEGKITGGHAYFDQFGMMVMLGHAEAPAPA
jgi:steroid delta-isomerase-like uncharacterized protein